MTTTLFHVDQREVNRHLLISLTSDEWNEAMRLAKQEDENFVIDLSRICLENMILRGRIFDNASFYSSSLDGSTFDGSSMRSADFSSASVRHASFYEADVTGSNVGDSHGWRFAYKSEIIGWREPQPDVTEQVAFHFLNEAINDPESEVCSGLQEIIDSGVRAWWSGNALKFYMTSEIEKLRDLCHSNECDCPLEHSCNGECDCCACYRGTCGCEKYHDDDNREMENTGDWYLATVIGKIKFEWSDTIGIYCKVVMEDRTMHPHVDYSGTICWGNAEIPDGIRVADHLLMVMGWIGQHNPASEYRDIEDLPFLR